MPFSERLCDGGELMSPFVISAPEKQHKTGPRVTTFRGKAFDANTARINKVPRVVVATSDGMVYIYDFNPQQGGVCNLIRQHNLSPRALLAVSLSERDGSSDALGGGSHLPALGGTVSADSSSAETEKQGEVPPDRLPHSPPLTREDRPKAPFLTWTTPDCERWLDSLGLSQYGAALRCWQASSGNHLSRATPSQLDKQLGVRHPLHRKKLQLAIAARMGVEGSLGRESPGNPIESAALSSVWVFQWLDDVGLPQYKEAFHEARIDPRVLDVLTWDDLAFLKINSLLHAISLKREVQVLREHNFDSSSLIRRSDTTASSPTDNNDNKNRSLNGNSSPSDAEDVCLWTNHRVMEWLRTVDLSEYAPNLRGSGVHGALLVYEVRFNAKVLAALLSIPSSKTLLRRHLNTHFKELVGREVVQEKRQVEDTPGYSPLTTATKIKPNKRSQFSLKRRSSSKSRGGHTLEFDDLLCPLEERPPRAAVERRALENSPETRLC